MRVARVVSWANRLDGEIGDAAPTTSGDLKKLQDAELSRIRTWFKDEVASKLPELEKVDGDPDAARRKADALSGELERIEAALERVPQIGMVTDRGGGA
jgi:molecular chaperone DnaK